MKWADRIKGKERVDRGETKKRHNREGLNKNLG